MYWNGGEKKTENLLKKNFQNKIDCGNYMLVNDGLSCTMSWVLWHLIMIKISNQWCRFRFSGRSLQPFRRPTSIECRSMIFLLFQAQRRIQTLRPKHRIPKTPKTFVHCRMFCSSHQRLMWPKMPTPNWMLQPLNQRYLWYHLKTIRPSSSMELDLQIEKKWSAKIWFQSQFSATPYTYQNQVRREWWKYTMMQLVAIQGMWHCSHLDLSWRNKRPTKWYKETLQLMMATATGVGPVCQRWSTIQTPKSLALFQQ